MNNIDEEISQWHSRIIVLQTLKDSEGWKMFKMVLDPLYEQALNGIVGAKDPYVMAKFSGQLAVAKDLSTWADREIHVAQMNIESLKESKKQQVLHSNP